MPEIVKRAGRQTARLGDLDSARLLLRAARTGECPDGATLLRLEDAWRDGFNAIHEVGEAGIAPWLFAFAARELGKSEDARAALEEARRDAPAAADPGPVYATLADAVSKLGEMRWLWPGWIPAGAMTLVAGNGGEGRTRTVMDLTRRLWEGLPWPDGSPNTLPSRTPTLWVLVDRNWQETAEVAKSFGVPLDAIHLNTLKAALFDLPEFDAPETIEALKAQIIGLGPGMVVIDTITYATSRNTNRAEEAKAAFDAIITLTVETGVPVVALAHLNTGGEVLGRRITERARSVISLTFPDKEGQPDRRRFWVSKSASKKPAPLGITFSDDANAYDFDPPEAPEEEASPKGRKPLKSTAFAEWLWAYLQSGPVLLAKIIDEARAAGQMAGPTSGNPSPSPSPLYNARNRIPAIHPGYVVDEFEAPVGRSAKSLKHWRIVEAEGASGVARGGRPSHNSEVRKALILNELWTSKSSRSFGGEGVTSE